MFSFEAGIFLGLLGCVICYEIHLSKLRAHTEREAFEHLAFGYIDALDVAGVKFGCSTKHLKYLVLKELDSLRQDQKERTRFELKYINSKGRYFSCGENLHGSHALFVMICTANWAKMIDDPTLLEWCESHMSEASIKNSFTIW